MRSFSSGVVDLLARERAEEVDTAVMPEDLKNLRIELQQDWKIVDDAALIKLYRTTDDNKKVQVSFHCQDTVEEEPSYDNEDGNDQEEEELAVPIRFTVTVSKAGKTLVFTCLTTEELSLTIQSTAITTEDPTTVQNNGGSVLSTNYQGPEFSELAEDLQDAFHSFLVEDIGISADLVSFITMYCDYKEQTEYVQWLEDAKALLS